MPRALIVAAVGLWLAGCSVSNDVSDPFGLKTAGADASATLPPGANAQANATPEASGTVPPPLGVIDDANLLGGDPTDDLSIGKKYYRGGNFGMAERYFRRAVEIHPRDAEAWLDLAAAYDRLRRFDLADRAYAQATGIIGPTAELLNNEGYSFMLRGDYTRARAKLMAAQRKDPANKYVANNLQLLATSASTGKAIQ
jgi:tetratricopeptide (TPR) repeat protein